MSQTRRLLCLLAAAMAAPLAAEARCGKNSEANGRTSCDASSGDLLLKFEDYDGGTTNDPLDDEYGSAFYTIRAGDNAGTAASSPEATDPQILSELDSRMHGQSMRFSTGQYLRIQDDSADNQLRTKFEAYVSFWIRARDTNDQQVIVTLSEDPLGSPAGCGGAGCDGFGVLLNDLGTQYNLEFRVMRAGAFAVQSCLTNDATDLGPGPTVPAFDYGEWYQVTIGGFYSENNGNAEGSASSNGFFRVVVNGTAYESGPDSCLETGGGDPREWVNQVEGGSNAGADLALLVGGYGGRVVDFDLDELRIDAWDDREVLATGCGAPKPGCQLACSTTTDETGCARSRGGLSGDVIGRGSDALGGVAITQVMFNPPVSEYESILLYRKFETAGTVDLSAGSFPHKLCESATAATEDDGTQSCWTAPASPALTMAPGDFAQVFLCESGAAGCNPTDDVSISDCKKYWTRAGAGSLGFGATATGNCTAGTCLNGDSATLQADLVSLKTDITVKSAVAWKESGRSAALAAFNPGITPGGDTYGLWPVDYDEGTGTLLGHEALSLTDNFDVEGVKLRIIGSNANPNPTDLDPLQRDWVEITATDPRLSCLSGAASTGSSPYLLDFEARGGDSRVKLTWVSGDETSIRGFNLYRSFDPEGPYEPIGFFASEHSFSGGETYSHDDRGLENGAVVWYGLEVIDDDGAVVGSWPRLQAVVGPAASAASGCAVISENVSPWTWAPSGVCIVLAIWVTRRRMGDARRS